MISSTACSKRESVISSDLGAVRPAPDFRDASHSPEAKPTALAPEFPRTDAHTHGVESVIAPVEREVLCGVCGHYHFRDERCHDGAGLLVAALLASVAIVSGFGCYCLGVWR